jgi:drug/metabolite transporter (DMT)-like permease
VPDSSASPGASPAPLAGVLAAFAAVYLIWGSTYLAIRFAVETMPPFTMAGVRFLAAGAILFAWSRARGAAPLTGPQWRTAAVAGVLLLVGGNGLVSWAEQSVPSGITALLIASTPMWMALIDWARPGGVRPRAGVWAGVALGLAGIAVLVGPGGLGGEPVDPLGALAIGTASFCWALGSIYQRSAPVSESTLLNVGGQMLAGGAVLVVLGAVLGERLVVADVSARSAASLAYLVFAGAVVGYSAYVWLLKVTTPAKASTYAFVNPLVAVVLGWALANEPLSPRVIGAGALVIGAVALITTAGSARPGAPAPAAAS